MMEFMKRLQHLEASGARSGSDASVNHRRHLHKHRSAMCLSMCLAAAGTSLVLSGCHGTRQQAETFSVPETFETNRNYEITFWAKNDTNKRQTDIYKKAIEDFEAIYPNITVNLRLYTDYGKIYNDGDHQHFHRNNP